MNCCYIILSGLSWLWRSFALPLFTIYKTVTPYFIIWSSQMKWLHWYTSLIALTKVSFSSWWIFPRGDDKLLHIPHLCTHVSTYTHTHPTGFPLTRNDSIKKIPKRTHTRIHIIHTGGKSSCHAPPLTDLIAAMLGQALPRLESANTIVSISRGSIFMEFAVLSNNIDRACSS